jgi:hypothetical protein
MTKQVTDPTIEQWRTLYDLAARIKKMEPWEWMNETDIFGIRDPLTNETGFVSVMGLAGEHIAIAYYPTTAATRQFLQIEEDAELGDGDIDPTRLLEIPKLELSFEDSDLVEKEDKAVHKKLGLKFRGPQSYTLFRSHAPALFPWFLTADEARLMTIVLEQLLDVAVRCDGNEDLLYPDGADEELSQDSRFLVREPNAQGEWYDTTQRLAPVTAAKPRYELSPESVAKLTKLPRIDRVVEVELQMTPFPAADKKGERPCFPYMLVIADQESGQLIAMELLEPRPSLESLFARVPQTLVDKLTEAGGLPQRLRVRSERVGDLLEPMAEQLRIHLRQSDRLKAIDSALGFMSQQLLGTLGLDDDDEIDLSGLSGLLGGGLFLPKR